MGEETRLLELLVSIRDDPQARGQAIEEFISGVVSMGPSADAELRAIMHDLVSDWVRGYRIGLPRTGTTTSTMTSYSAPSIGASLSLERSAIKFLSRIGDD